MTEPTHHVNVTMTPSATDPPLPPVIFLPKPGSVFFDDGERRIDFVLVFEKDEDAETKDTADQSNVGAVNVLKRLEALPHIGHDTIRSGLEREKLRIFFESNLVNEGLELEEDVRKEEDGRMTIFVKLHAPWAVVCRQAEILKMKMPLKLRDTFVQQEDTQLSLVDQIRRPLLKLAMYLKELISPQCKSKSVGGVFVRPQTATVRDRESKLKQELPKRVTWQFRRKKLDRFEVTDPKTFFSPTQRMEIVWEIMQKVRNNPDDEKKRGIEMLLHTGVYDAAFPLHDAGNDIGDQKAAPISEWPQRLLLRNTWANWKAMFKRQPLDLIRSYYGEKIAFYFAFLGFYTKMLLFPAIVGVGAFFFGVFYPVDDEMIGEICNQTGPPGTLYLCPACQPPTCEFLQYNQHCAKAVLATWMDNEATIIVAFVTVAWATIFRKKWKQREAELSFEWDVYEMEQEDIVIRPEYEHRAPMTRPNPVTRQVEPYVPPMLRLRWKAASTTVTLLMLLAVACALAALVIARIAMYGALKRIGVHENVEVARWLVHGLIFVTVVIFDAVYNWVAEKVTSLECPRTRSEWLSSFLWKVFTFELLNDFVPIAYAAFVKGRTVRTPLDLDWKSELCEATGCMSEVTELIAVLLLARMFVGNAAEIGVPFLKHYLNRLICDTASTTGAVARPRGQSRAGRRPPAKPKSHAKMTPVKSTTTNRVQQPQTLSPGRPEVEIEEKRWRADVLLGELELDGVANEYMEMIVQFAFCTLFVPAFPIAAAVCFLNNILEIRVDAIKILASHRRPLPIRVSGIGIWNEFLGVIVKLAVLCNAGLVAFTSDAIVRLYYNFVSTDGFTYKGYPQFSLSRIDIPELWKEELLAEHEHLESMDKCYYSGHRSTTAPFNITMDWWIVGCVRLGAFGIFVAVGFTFQFVYDALVPDVPEHVAVKIQRQRYVLSKAMENEVTYEQWLRNHNGQVHQSPKKEEKPPDVKNGHPPSITRRGMSVFRHSDEKSRAGSMQRVRIAWSDRKW